MDEFLIEFYKLQNKQNSCGENIKTRSEQSIQRLDVFYKLLATLSAGAIVLSITFVSNIESSSLYKPAIFYITNYHILILSWIFLLFCLLFCLFQGFNNIQYLFYADFVPYLEASLNKEKYLHEQDKNGNIADNNSEVTEENITILNKVLSKTKWQSNINLFMYRLFEALARIFFLLGITMLTIFAILIFEPKV